jgi:mannitol/fructose-specific phosphotransferase system IIA component (Ntr-type)
MDLDDLLGPKPDIVDLRAEDRWTAIDELMSHLVHKGKIKPEQKAEIVAGIRRREASMSTGIGFGIGLPHTTTDMVSEVITVIGRSWVGVQFDAVDRQPVKLVVLFLVPAGDFQKYLNTLANVAKLLHRDDVRDRLWRRFI